MPVSTATSVDFPAPLRPTSARESPAGTRMETLLSAWLMPKRLDTPSTSTIAGPDAEASRAGCSGVIVVPPTAIGPSSALHAVRPQIGIVDVGLGDGRRRQHVHRVAVDHRDHSVVDGRAARN